MMKKSKRIVIVMAMSCAMIANNLSVMAADTQDTQGIVKVEENKNVEANKVDEKNVKAAGEYDLASGTLTVDENTCATCAGHIVKGTWNKAGSAIVVNGGTHSITLKDINAKSTDASVIKISAGTVNLKLEGTTTLTAGSGQCAIEVAEGAALNIVKESTGILVANGSENSAAIGGSNGKKSGNLTFSGGTVTALSGKNGVAIGSGKGAACGSITISESASVEANQGKEGFAAIGAGKDATEEVGTLTLNGATAVLKAVTPDATATVAPLALHKVKTQTLAKGIMFTNKNGIVYGSVNVVADMTIASGETLTIPAGADLTVASGKMIMVEGTLTNNNKINNNGHIYKRGVGKVDGTGTVTGNQVEVAPELTESSIVIDEDNTTYNGTALTPATVKVGDKVLEVEKDYTIDYVNNEKPAKSTDTDAPTVKITGKGIYTGTVSKKFTIKKAKPSLAVSLSKSGKDVTVQVTVKPDFGKFDNLPTANQIQIVAPNTNVKTALTKKANSGVYTGVYTATKEKAQFTVTCLGNEYYTNDADAVVKEITVEDDTTVTPKDTTTKVEVSKSTVAYGDKITYTATVADKDAGSDAIEGNVTFYKGSIKEANKLGNDKEVDANGKASIELDTTTVGAGTHTVYAVYSGSQNQKASEGKVKITVAKRMLAWDTSELKATKNKDGNTTAKIQGTLKVAGILDDDKDNVKFVPGTLTGVYKSADVAKDVEVTVTAKDAKLTGEQASNYQLPSTAIKFNGTITATTSTSGYKITASASTGGTISPSGTQTVAAGKDIKFTFKPNTGYKVASVLVDGKSVGVVTTYEFKDVKSTHTLKVNFVKGSSSTSTSNKKTSSNVKTGDETPVMAWFSLMAVALLGIVGVFFGKRRKSNK